ncbi:MAG TPA: hypothetical protein VJ785_15975 [Anaerolineales bacterium]|nr:hypothetical protein [Anaerolineales bacterium]
MDSHQFSRNAWEANAPAWDARMGDEGNDFFNTMCAPNDMDVHPRALVHTRAPNWPFGAPDPSSRVIESGAEDPGGRRGLWIRCRCCSDRSNFGEPLD